MFKEAIITFFTAMLPVVELRGAIPYGVIAGLSVPAAFIISVIGNLVPIPFAVVFIRRFFEWFRTINSFFDKIVSWFEAKAERNKGKVLQYEFWGLVLLVAIPLPGTGAWTGALVATLLDIRIQVALPCILIGVLIAGGVTLGVASGIIHLWG